jgi:F-type H+-transporting ATPase subunit b
MELLKLLNGSEILAQVLSFFLILWLLRIFVWKKILTSLDERKNHIASEYKKIEDTKSEVARLRADYEERLLLIENEARQRIQEALEKGRTHSEEIRRNAQHEAQKIIDSAREEIKFELVKAKDDLKKRIVELTVLVTEQLLQERLTEEADNRLVRDFLDKVDTI